MLPDGRAYGAAGGGGLDRLRSRLPKDELEYAQALGTVALLGLALALFGYLLVRNGPKRALSFVLSRAGVK